MGSVGEALRTPRGAFCDSCDGSLRPDKEEEREKSERGGEASMRPFHVEHPSLKSNTYIHIPPLP